MGFTTTESRVEVNIYKPSGKWYATASVDMGPFYKGMLLHDAFLAACVREFELDDGGQRGEWGLSRSPRDLLADGFTLVCTAPHHEHAHPILLRLAVPDDVDTSAPDEPQREYRLATLIRLLRDQKLREEARQMFHAAWGNAAQHHYDKELWKKLQNLFGM